MRATADSSAEPASTTPASGSSQAGGTEVATLAPGAPTGSRRRVARALRTVAPDTVLALFAGAAVLASTGLLIARLAPAVGSKPLFEDEAVAGLIGARPLSELLHTVLVDRGGAPLHFVLAHAALAIDPSWQALRWLSVVFAVATVPLVFDLARRLGGLWAGALAAVVTASSMMLGVYGSFGRMYSLFAFVAALAVDLFVRAVQRRTTSAAILAALAAWLLPAVHPYGIILVAAEVAVALAVWRGRSWRPALAVGLIGLAAVPFLWADLRLSDRFAVGLGGGTSLADPGDAWSQLARALAAFAGGSGALFVFFLLLGGLGLGVMARRNRPFAALALISLVVTPLLFMLLATARSAGLHGLSPRHLVFLLPIWAALVGGGVARLLERVPVAVAATAVAGVALAAALAPPGGVRDPRDIESNVALGGGTPALAPGEPAAIAAPAAWLRQSLQRGDIAYPISPVFFAALPAAASAYSLPRAETGVLLNALHRVSFPARSLFVAVPAGSANLELSKMRTRLGPGFELHAFPRWLVVRANGPFTDEASVLVTTFWIYRAAARAFTGDVPVQVQDYVTYGYSVVCDSLRDLNGHCTERPST